MVINFAQIDPRERPVLVLRNLGGDALASLGYAFNVRVKLCYNEVSELTFDLPAFTDGEKTPDYEKVIGMRMVELQGFGLFLLSDPSESDTGKRKVKSCKAYSLEYEFTYKKISMPKGTYEFYNAVGYEDSIVGRLHELLPKWTYQVDDTLIGRFRTFEVSGENVYNFMKSTLQTSYGCIFDFDTYNRVVRVRDVNRQAQPRSVFLSTQNLIKEISVNEDTEGIVTCLDVNGAEGVNIRDVNPIGSNKIYNLDYFLTEENFTGTQIGSWNTWKAACEAGQKRFYELSLEQELEKSRLSTEQANLVDLQGKLKAEELKQSAAMEALVKVQDDPTLKETLDKVTKEVEAQRLLVQAKEDEIGELEKEIQGIDAQLKEYAAALKPSAYFKNDWAVFEPYFKEDSVTDSSFAMSAVTSYTARDVRGAFGGEYWVSESTITKIVQKDRGTTIYSMEGGVLSVPEKLGTRFPAKVVRATLERTAENRVVLGALLNLPVTEKEEEDEREFRTAYLSLTGTCPDPSVPGNHSITDDAKPDPESGAYDLGTWVKFPVPDAFVYLTESATEYEQRSVSWSLYDYGVETLQKLAYPSYTFSVSSANFLALEEFEEFRNQLELGEKIYLHMGEDKIWQPFVIGLELAFDDPSGFTIQFSDKYCASDAAFRLVDLLEQSVSMGKSVDFSKYTYREFVDSGAQTEVRSFINSALDVSKNAVLSSRDQAISWDESGLKLRKWKNNQHHDQGYEGDQIAMVNNNIVFTENGFESAKMAIGRFEDKNRGSCFGVVAPNIVGTLLAGEYLQILNKGEDGETVMFRVDETGAMLHNAEFDIVSGAGSKAMQIALNPKLGIAIGKNPVYQNGALNKANATFYVDIESGDAFFEGTVKAQEYLDKNGNKMMTGDYKFTSDYLDLHGLTITNGSSTTLRIDQGGNITMKGDITLTNGGGASGTFITGTSIYAPTIESPEIIWYDTNKNRLGRIIQTEGEGIEEDPTTKEPVKVKTILLSMLSDKGISIEANNGGLRLNAKNSIYFASKASALGGLYVRKGLFLEKGANYPLSQNSGGWLVVEDALLSIDNRLKSLENSVKDINGSISSLWGAINSIGNG